MPRKRAAGLLRYAALTFLAQAVVLLRSLEWDKIATWISAPVPKGRVSPPRGEVTIRGAAAAGGGKEPLKPAQAKPAEAKAPSPQQESQGFTADLQRGLQEQAQKALDGTVTFIVGIPGAAVGFVGDRVEEQRERIAKAVEAKVNDVVSAPGRLAQEVVSAPGRLAQGVAQEVVSAPGRLAQAVVTDASNKASQVSGEVSKVPGAVGAAVGATIGAVGETIVNVPSQVGASLSSQARGLKREAEDVLANVPTRANIVARDALGMASTKANVVAQDVSARANTAAQGLQASVAALPEQLVSGAQASVRDAGATLAATLAGRATEISDAIVSTPEVVVNDAVRFATKSVPNFLGRIVQSRVQDVSDSTKRFADDIGQAPGKTAQVTGAKVKEAFQATGTAAKEAVQATGTAATVVFIEAPTSRVKAAVKSTGRLVEDVQSAPSVLSRKVGDVVSDAVEEAKKIPDRLVSSAKEVSPF